MRCEVSYLVATALAPGSTVDDQLLAELAPELNERDRLAMLNTLKICAPHRAARAKAADAFETTTAPLDRETLREARLAILNGQAEAQARMAFATHPGVLAHGLPMIRFSDDALMARLRSQSVFAPAFHSNLRKGVDAAQGAAIIPSGDTRVMDNSPVSVPRRPPLQRDHRTDPAVERLE